MYVYEEMVEGQKLSEIINNTHVNLKYLPSVDLPENVVSVFMRVKKTSIIINDTQPPFFILACWYCFKTSAESFTNSSR